MNTPADIALAFLRALESRDLPAAGALLAPGAVMEFPGGARFTALADLIAWSRPRYASVAKTVEAVETLGAVVYARGTLHGVWPDGAAFAGIRFIDRFEIAGGLIVAQQVWNDIAEARR